MSSAWQNFKNIFSRPRFTIIFRPKMIKFHPYYILTGEGKVDKEGKKRAAHIFALLKNTSATPTLLLLKKRSGTPPSLPILGVALRCGAQKSGAL